MKFRFATDGEGNYGYLGADDSFIPFKSGEVEYYTSIENTGDGQSKTLTYEAVNTEKLLIVITFTSANIDVSNATITISNATVVNSNDLIDTNKRVRVVNYELEINAGDTADITFKNTTSGYGRSGLCAFKIL